MTIYTLTDIQYTELAANAHAFDSSTLAILRSLKPNSQEPVGFLSKNGHLYETLCAAGDGSEPLYTHPAPISKENMVKVSEALQEARTCDDSPQKWDRNKEAFLIMQSAIKGMK
jgi:hypothetical protein